MHELSVTQSVLDIIVRHAEQAGAKRIVRVHLVVGELSSIVDDSVQFYFDFLARETLAEGAGLVFKRLPVTLLCAACQRRWKPTNAGWTCPSCSAAQGQVVEGREFYVDSIEVE